MLNLIGLLVSGCGSQEERLEWERIVQDDIGNQYAGYPKITMVTSQEEVSILQNEILPRDIEQVLDCDFSEYVVLVIFRGYRGIGDCSIEVIGVTQDDDVITVDARFLEPDPREVLKTIETSPYYVLKIKKAPDLRGEFIFVLIADSKEIMRQSRVIP
jgi:hypothetical protein